MALTFLRPGEVRHGEWEEIDFAEKLWRIPAKRMKMRLDHIVPLSNQACDILHELFEFSGDGKFMFPGLRSNARVISDVTFLAALRRMGYEKSEMCAHGFRSMASTLLNEQGYPADAIEKQLAHNPSNKIRGIYNRAEYLPERRKVMQKWADHLDNLRKKPFPSESYFLIYYSGKSEKRGKRTSARDKRAAKPSHEVRYRPDWSTKRLDFP